ncbi:MAG TPA: HD domain-containing protein [Candidatus Nitrosotalea sp.]|nr:HD domain-containing protein [Candidatus Nitrosotalea sp.]
MAHRELNIAGLLVKRGAMRWGDEAVSVLDHALQCAARARAFRATDEVVLAALLHDVGHLVSDAEESPVTHHGLWAARFLRPFVPAKVAWLVEYHVMAKRYLCTVDRTYAESLSLGSLRSWIRQGGTLDQESRRELERQAWLPDVLAMRRWDEAAKEPRARVPGLPVYRDLIEACFGRQPWEVCDVPAGASARA